MYNTFGKSKAKFANRSVALAPQIWRIYQNPPMEMLCDRAILTPHLSRLPRSIAHSLARSIAHSLAHSLVQPLAQRPTTSNDEERPSDDNQRSSSEKRQRITTRNDEQRRATTNKALPSSPFTFHLLSSIFTLLSALL